MGEYLLRARDPSGKLVTEIVEADSTDEAIESLIDRGYDTITLLTDDVEAHYAKPSATVETLSPREFAALKRRRGPLKMTRLIAWKFYVKNWWISLLSLGLLVERHWNGGEWGFWDAIILWALVSPIVSGLFLDFFGSGTKYRRLIAAASWGRWDEVLRQAPKLEGVKGIKPEEIAFRKGAALAGLGDFEAGIAEVAPYSDGEAMPRWLYICRVCEIYRAAGRRAETIALLERARELAPDNTSLMIDLSNVVLTIDRDVNYARELLDLAASRPIGEVARPFLAMNQGLLAIETRRFEEARDILLGAIREIRAFLDSSPLVGSTIDFMHAYLAVAYSGLGQHDEAVRHYRKAEPRLVALKSHIWIDRCRKELGGYLA